MASRVEAETSDNNIRQIGLIDRILNLIIMMQAAKALEIGY